MSRLKQANEKNDNKMVNELSEKLEALGEKLGPEYTALMDGLPDIDQDFEVGQEIEVGIVEPRQTVHGVTTSLAMDASALPVYKAGIPSCTAHVRFRG